jgi:hypothetical protein
VLRQAIPPLVTAYAIFVAMVVVTRRRPVPRPRGPDGAAGRPLVSVLGTVIGGYLGFLAIVLIFHVWLGGEDDAFRSALGGGALLLAVAFALALVSIARYRT